jgi:hypothetical protein
MKLYRGFMSGLCGNLVWEEIHCLDLLWDIHCVSFGWDRVP